MTRCLKCNRRLTAPSPTGYGPVCARSLFGVKPKAQAKSTHRRNVSKDTDSLDLFAAEVPA